MNNIIKIKNLNFSYPESKSKAIENLSFQVPKGSWFTILGRNGSGKSTITRLIDGLLESEDKDSRIEIDNKILNGENVWQVRKEIGIVFQNPDNQFVGATVGDDVAFGLENRAVNRDKMKKIVKDSLQAVGMLDYIDSEPNNLSGGQKQRVAIAGIIAVEPKIIILDEATSMLDPQGKHQILNLIEELKEKNNLTIISITHDINEALLADQILVINKGKKIANGKPKEIFSKLSLDNIGLEKPFIYKLQDKLKNAGVELSKRYQNEDELVNALCQLNLNM